MAWWKIAVDWYGYAYRCGCFATQGEGDVPRALRLCRLDELAKFYDHTRPADLGHQCDPCPYAEHNAILATALAPVDDPEFL